VEWTNEGTINTKEKENTKTKNLNFIK